MKTRTATVDRSPGRPSPDCRRPAARAAPPSERRHAPPPRPRQPAPRRPAPARQPEARDDHGRRPAARQHPGRLRRVQSPGRPVRGQVPLDHGRGRGVQLDRADVHAALAAGTLPDVFTIPFTDGKGLIAQDQIVDIDARVRALPYADKFNPNVLVNGQDDAGKIFAVPTQAYGMSLTYNRTLFTQAGLDPDKPPTTWDEVRAAAKTIAEKTHIAGFARWRPQNTGGWQLTTFTYALGGRMETTGSDGKVTATVNNAATKSALAAAQGHPLDGRLDGLDLRLRAGARSTRRSRPARSACSLGGSDLYTAMVQNNSLNPADYGVTTIPLAEDPNAGVLGGGTLAAVNVATTRPSATRQSLDRLLLHEQANTQDGAVADAKALVANKQPVGVPALPIFDKATYDESQTWIKDYINVPTNQMTPFTTQDLRPAARQRADRSHPGPLRGARPGRAGGPDRQERRHRRAARCRQHPGPGHPRQGLTFTFDWARLIPPGPHATPTDRRPKNGTRRSGLSSRRPDLTAAVAIRPQPRLDAGSAGTGSARSSSCSRCCSSSGSSPGSRSSGRSS